MLPHPIDKFIDDFKIIPNKNNGGCLFFCYVFWLWINKFNHPKDDFKIIQYDYSAKKIEYNVKWLKGESDSHPLASYHFTWIFQGVEYDAEGFVKQSSYESKHREILDIDFNLIEKFFVDALNNNDWNDSFDRVQAISYIKHLYDIDLDHIKKLSNVF